MNLGKKSIFYQKKIILIFKIYLKLKYLLHLHYNLKIINSLLLLQKRNSNFVKIVIFNAMI